MSSESSRAYTASASVSLSSFRPTLALKRPTFFLKSCTGGVKERPLSALPMLLCLTDETWLSPERAGKKSPAEPTLFESVL